MSIERNFKTANKQVKVAGVEVDVPVIARGDARNPNITPRITSTLTGGDLAEDVLDRGALVFGAVEFIGKKDDAPIVASWVKDGQADLGIIDANLTEEDQTRIFSGEDLVGYSLLDENARKPEPTLTILTRKESDSSGIRRLINAKRYINENPSGSHVLIDPCEITMDLVKADCPYRTEDASLCSKGVLMQEGTAYCPIQPQRQLTLRSDFPVVGDMNPTG